MKKILFTLIICLLILSIEYCNADWQPTNGPFGGDISCFAISGGNIYTGTQNGGVYLSPDNGASWTAVNNGLTNADILSLAIKGDTIFAGTSGGGVFISTHNGGSWKAVNNGLTNTVIRTLAISGKNIFAGTYGGVFLSTDNGANWTDAGLANTEVFSFAISGGNIFAGTWGGGVFLSTNNGANWTSMNNRLTNDSVTSLAISGKNIFAGTWKGIFLSTNNGESWTAMNSGLTNTFIHCLAIKDDTIFAGTFGEGGVFLSTNNGESWAAVNNGLNTTYNVWTISISGESIFTGTYGGGVYLSSNNGVSWKAVGPSFTFNDAESIAIKGDTLLAGTFGGGIFSSIHGEKWSAMNLSNQYVMCLTSMGENIYAGFDMGGVYLSTDNGGNWTAMNNGLPYDSVTGQYFPILSFAKNGGNIFAGTYEGGIYLSTDNGGIWTAMNKGLTNDTILSLAISDDGKNIYAGTWKGEGGGVYLSTNNGGSWTNVLANNDYISSFAISGTNIYAGTEGKGVFLSTNNGLSWTSVNNGLLDPYVYSLAVSGENIFAGTDQGLVFLSTNNGAKWTLAANGLPDYPDGVQWSLALNEDTIYAGTGNSGVWKRALSEIITSCITPAPTVAGGNRCGAGAVTLQASGGATYLWYNAASGGNVISVGSAFTTPVLSTTTTYYVSNFDNCESVRIPVIAEIDSLPTVTASVSSSAICNGNSINLTSTGSSYTGILLYENFNGPTNSFTTINNSTGEPAIAAWTLEPNGYTDTIVSDNTTFHSNDNTQFYMSNSWANTGATATILESPSINTIGYSSLSLDFYQYYSWYTSATAEVDVSTDGINWTRVAIYTRSVGSATAFAHTTIPLNAYTGKATFYFRFNYNSPNGWYWAIDNVTLSGRTANYNYTWNSTPAGFNSLVQNPPNVYPTVSTTYTVTYSNTITGGCSNSGSASVTINPLPTAEISGTTTICNGGSSNISIALTGTEPWNVTYTDGTNSYQLSDIRSQPILISVSPSSTKTYIITAISDANCRGTSMTGAAIVTVNPSPSANISPAGPISILKGQKIFLQVTFGAEYNYQWYRNDTLITGQNDDSLGVTQTGIYYAIVSQGVCSINTNIVDVLPLSNFQINITAKPNTICSGQTTNLQAQVSGGSGNDTIQWNQIYEGGTFYTLVQNGANIYAGSYGTIFLSTNNGVSWTTVNYGLPNTYIIAVAIIGKYIFAGTDGQGLYLSPDNGTSWKPINNGLKATLINSFTINGNNIFAGCNTGIYLSSDTGTSWRAVNDSLNVSVLAISGNNIYAGTSTGVYFSSDNGASWVARNNGLPKTEVRAIAIKGTNIFIGNINGNVYLSTNNGGNWNILSRPESNPAAWVNSLIIMGSDILAGTATGVYLSNNNGASWITEGLSDVTVLSLAARGSNILAGIFDGELYSSNVSNIWGNYTYEWNTGQTSSLFKDSPGVTTQYVVTATNTLTLVKEKDSVIVAVNPIPGVRVADTSIFTNTTGTLIANASGVSYLWQNGDTTQSILVSSTGTFCVTVTDMKTTCEASACGIVSIKYPASYSISGILTYDNSSNTPMNNTTIYIKNTEGEKLDSTTTDNTGRYDFENVVNGTYSIVCGNTRMKWGGSNPVDALIVNRFYVGLIDVFGDAMENTAANVSNGIKINPIDALMIDRRYVNLITKFNIPDWIFESTTVTVNDSAVVQNIKAICAGDVNGTYVPRN